MAQGRNHTLVAQTRGMPTRYLPILIAALSEHYAANLRRSMRRAMLHDDSPTL